MKVNRNKENVKKKVRPFTEEEFLTVIGLLMAAAEYGQQGASLRKEGARKEGHTLHEQTIIAIGYSYSAKKTLLFAMTSNAGSTKPECHYEIKYTDPFGNIKTLLVECPAVLSDFFLDSNMSDCQIKLGSMT